MAAKQLKLIPVYEQYMEYMIKLIIIDRIVHRWIVDNFLLDTFVSAFINTSYACIKGRGMHMAALDVQKAMQKCERKWKDYYVIKTDVAK